jgi:hypothetical protein
LKTPYRKIFFISALALGGLLLWQIFRHRAIYNEHCKGSRMFAIGPFGRIVSPLISESSGLLRRSDSLFYTFNDDSDSCLFLISARGNLKSRMFIPFSNRDWEDISGDGRGRLFIGDIGNNFYRKKELKILIYNSITRIPEGTNKEKNRPATSRLWYGMPTACTSFRKTKRKGAVWYLPFRPEEGNISSGPNK